MKVGIEKCKALHVIEDPVSVMSYRCELPLGHEGAHKTTYPGVEGDIRESVYWNTPAQRTEFERGDSRQDRDLKPRRYSV